ncbi:hypothetical protein CDAR_204151 [Caerostris darwini]|uniref:Uncharacterized protein n=1 Tax=Caerostris darwini TaxID=1538125 RepID=A0AAV4QKW0_9ARAC|nr:hypothetical protein CDAR_204151 [Caerostris darwini]
MGFVWMCLCAEPDFITASMSLQDYQTVCLQFAGFSIMCLQRCGKATILSLHAGRHGFYQVESGRPNGKVRSIKSGTILLLGVQIGRGDEGWSGGEGCMYFFIVTRKRIGEEVPEMSHKILMTSRQRS